jgi:hypothetical protein
MQTGVDAVSNGRNLRTVNFVQWAIDVIIFFKENWSSIVLCPIPPFPCCMQVCPFVDVWQSAIKKSSLQI